MSEHSNTQQEQQPQQLLLFNQQQSQNQGGHCQLLAAALSNGINNTNYASHHNNNNYVNFNQFMRQHNFLESNNLALASNVNPFQPYYNNSSENIGYNNYNNGINHNYDMQPSTDRIPYISTLNVNSPEFLPRFKELTLEEYKQENSVGMSSTNNSKIVDALKHAVDDLNTTCSSPAFSASPTPPPPGAYGYTGGLSRNNVNNSAGGNANKGRKRSDNRQNRNSQEKYSAARAERDRERDRRRYQQNERRYWNPDEEGAAAAAPNGYNEQQQQQTYKQEEGEVHGENAGELVDHCDRNESNGGGVRAERNIGMRSNSPSALVEDRAERRGNERWDRNNRVDRGSRGNRFNNNRGNGGGAGAFGRKDNSSLQGDNGSNSRWERDGGYRGNRNKDRNNYQRADNYRSNKRHDDWNRNRDRINGFHLEDKFSADSSKESPVQSPEKSKQTTNMPKKIYPDHEKLSQREKLVRDIETRRLECPVCVEHIKVHQPVWSCQNCYHIFHLNCIAKWANSSKSEDGWRCPACQNIEKDVPSDYHCFCGKVKDPQYNHQDVAHSCGEVCGRIEGCTHACTLLCHPGPCPPCHAVVQRQCGCGKTLKQMQCSLKNPIECDSKCGKLLNCELHECEAKCHNDKCPPCDNKVSQTCHCSKQERQVACTRDSNDKHVYSCGKPCGKDLSCGNHKCKDCCHAGDCRPCKMSPEMVNSCPCGKMLIPTEQRKTCLDPIPLCENVCGKTLRCGKSTRPHQCESKCHLGNCPPCNKQTSVKCRCGHMDQLIKCRQLSTRGDDVRCKKRCTKKRSCGKHKCNQECCIDIDHICPAPCNYTLSCGKHKCDSPCHRGNCGPCYRTSFNELYCECGAEVIYPPVKCGTKRPVCTKPCSRQHPCEHPPQHHCHAGPSCPPCMMFTTKSCWGQHEQKKTVPCSVAGYSCGQRCGKPLSCGKHKCVKTCHEGPCQAPGEVCKQSCTKKRLNCEHNCMAPCHGDECPDTPCKELVEIQCECGLRKQKRPCYDITREFTRLATAQLASSMSEMARGNYMELNEILLTPKASKFKNLECTEECRLQERNRRLAAALSTRPADAPEKILTKYTDFTRNFAKRDPVLVKSIHDELTNLVKLAKESKQKSRSHSFPIMNREKRQLVHEMCEIFGVDSVSYDAEPNRNVVATAHKDRSWLPATSIMEVMRRESGQRRVPVPSNNAWGLKR